MATHAARGFAKQSVRVSYHRFYRTSFDSSRSLGPCYELLSEKKISSRWQLRRSKGLVPMVGRLHEAPDF